MRDAFKLLRFLAEREHVLDVGRTDRVVSEFIFTLLARLQVVRSNTERAVPLLAQIAPILVPLHRLGRMAEELDLHLLEFARTEGVVARIDLVAKRFADLRDSER